MKGRGEKCPSMTLRGLIEIRALEKKIYYGVGMTARAG